jgi:hypothetical protein
MNNRTITLFREMRDERRRRMKFFLQPQLSHLDFVVVAMGFIATVTTLTGFVYSLPPDTFGLGKSFVFMRDHGGENFWAIVILIFGVLALVSTYLEYYRLHYFVIYGERPPQNYQPDRLLGRWIWFGIALLWGFVGCSFLVNIPVSPGAAIYVPLGVFSYIVSIKVRDRRDNGD